MGMDMNIDQITERAQNPLKAAIYARTAAASQDCNELLEQIEACKAEAARCGWAVNEDFIFADESVSGLGPAGKGLQRMADTIHRQPHTCDVVVVSDEARLGRNVSSLAMLLSILQYHNVLVHSVAAGGTVTLFGMLQCDRCRGGQAG